jgi:hypothetical protein
MNDGKRIAVALPIGIFVFTFVFRLFIAWRVGLFRDHQQDEMVRIALSLLKYHEYGNPYLIRTGPTAHEMPLYPLFLSGVYALFGTGNLAEAVKITLACAASALRCAMLPFFCLEAGLDRIVGIVAGGVSAVYVSALQTELRGNWDHPWQALVLLLLTWMTLRLWRDRSWLARIPWRYFIVWGFGILLQPAYLPVLAAFLLAGLIAAPQKVRPRYLKLSAALLLTVSLFLVPWAVRNQLRLGKLIFTRSNFGLEFWVSNGPGRAFDMQTNLGFAVPHPSLNLSEAQSVLRLGEVRYNQLKLNEAKAWVRANPEQFARLTTRRFLAWWFPPGRNIVQRILNYVFSLLALAGAVILFRRQRLTAVLFFLTWISFPCVYYIIQWSSKYRYSTEWELVICVALTLRTVFCPAPFKEVAK